MSYVVKEIAETIARLAVAMAESRTVVAQVNEDLRRPWRGLGELVRGPAEPCTICGKFKPAGQPCPRCR